MLRILYLLLAFLLSGCIAWPAPTVVLPGEVAGTRSIIRIKDAPCSNERIRGVLDRVLKESAKPWWPRLEDFRSAVFLVIRTGRSIEGCWFQDENDIVFFWANGDHFAVPVDRFRSADI